MGNDNVVSLAAPAPVPDPLTELLRSGARRLIEAAVAVMNSSRACGYRLLPIFFHHRRIA